MAQAQVEEEADRGPPHSVRLDEVQDMGPPRSVRLDETQDKVSVTLEDCDTLALARFSMPSMGLQ